MTGKWHVDETYIKVRGQWMYLYRARNSLAYGPVGAAWKLSCGCLHSKTIDVGYYDDAFTGLRFREPFNMCRATIGTSNSLPWFPPVIRMRGAPSSPTIRPASHRPPPRASCWAPAKMPRLAPYVLFVCEERDKRGVAYLARPVSMDLWVKSRAGWEYVSGIEAIAGHKLT